MDNSQNTSVEDAVVLEDSAEQDGYLTAFDGMSENEMIKEMAKSGLIRGKHLSIYTKSKPTKTERKKKRKQQQASRKKNRGKTKGQKRSN